MTKEYNRYNKKTILFTLAHRDIHELSILNRNVHTFAKSFNPRRWVYTGKEYKESGSLIGRLGKGRGHIKLA